LTDSDPVHVETLRRRFGHLENIEINQVDFDNEETPMPGIDTVLVFDGLQRALEPKELLARVARVVDPGTKLLLQLPAGTDLMGPTDIAAGHLRRFDLGDVEDLIHAVGLELLLIEPFNRLGAWGWRFHHALGAGRISRAEAVSFDFLVPLAKKVDAFSSRPGLSWLVVARVP
jgi:hypothetical protein